MAMQNIGIVLFLMVVMSLLSPVAKKTHIPYPVLLVLAGALIGFLPMLPDLELQPEWVFLIFLPPLLHESATELAWNEFRLLGKPILLLAVGLVVVTTFAVAYLAHSLIPGFTWAIGLTLGAIISPPDAVAATSVTERMGLPKRLTTLLRGEGLINDATALILYHSAVAAVMGAQFSFWPASLDFVKSVVGGTAIGFAVGFAFSRIQLWSIELPEVATAATLLTPFASYLLAENFHLSGVLAVVVSGLYLTSRSRTVVNFEARARTKALWETFGFLLNGLVFILIGMRLPSVVRDRGSLEWPDLILDGILISALIFTIRFVWIFVMAKITNHRRGTAPPADQWKNLLVTSWTGMRGVVSLAAALALPVSLSNGSAFPERQHILLLTFELIFITLVVQGLALPVLIKVLKIKPENHEARMRALRVKVAEHTLQWVTETQSGKIPDNLLARLKQKSMLELSLNRAIEKNDQGPSEDVTEYYSVYAAMLDEERRFLEELRKENSFNEEYILELEENLDIENLNLRNANHAHTGNDLPTSS